MIRRAFYKIVWVITYILFWPIIRIFYKMEIEFDKSIRTLKRPLILISNHKTPIDAWILAGAIPFRLFIQILPIYIMGSRRFASGGLNVLGKMGIINLVYGAYGVISLPHLKEREDKLRPFAQALERKGSVLIFPEGKIRKEDNVGHFKDGTALLHLSTGAPILPASIKFESTDWRKTCLIRFGKILTFDKDRSPSDLEITARLRDEVESLYTK